MSDIPFRHLAECPVRFGKDRCICTPPEGPTGDKPKVPSLEVNSLVTYGDRERPRYLMLITSLDTPRVPRGMILARVLDRIYGDIWDIGDTLYFAGWEADEFTPLSSSLSPTQVAALLSILTENNHE